MPVKFQNKYRIDSTRLKNWDYGNNGAYFITICTKNRELFFGNIFNKKMCLNKIGNFAEKFWLEIPKHFPFVELGNYVVMPNHVHGILIVNRNDDVNVETLHCNVSNAEKTINNNVNKHETLQCNVSTDETNKNEYFSKISPKSGTISTIIRSYKSVVSKNAHFVKTNFDWQSKFHDHVIRNSESFERIQNYIEKNPENWNEDKFYN
jgi:putative transposase